MKFIPAKSIVTRAKCPEQWLGTDYNMNIYRGCCHGCIYCDNLCRKIEPKATASSKRFSALRELSGVGIFAGILLMPVLPFIEDNKENVIRITELAAKSGAKFIYPAFGVTLRQNQRDYFYRCLDKSFPGLKERYVRLYGDEYRCVSPNSKELWEVFMNSCEKYGLLYRMQDIIKSYKHVYDDMQLSLF